MVLAMDSKYGGQLLIKEGKGIYAIHDVGITYEYLAEKGFLRESNGLGIDMGKYLDFVVGVINKKGTFYDNSTPMRGSNEAILNFLDTIDDSDLDEGDSEFIPCTVLALNVRDLESWFRKPNVRSYF